MADSADQSGEQVPHPQPTDSASLTEKSVHGPEAKQRQQAEDPPLSSSISLKEKPPSSAGADGVSKSPKSSPKPRKRSAAVSQTQAVVSVPEEATTVGGGDGALTRKELHQDGHKADDSDSTKANAAAVPSYAPRTVMNGMSYNTCRGS